ncbi:MAG: hypothetical protein K6A35_10450, partial [bacterium]|nr:hypothetical protein [bacterium]
AFPSSRYLFIDHPTYLVCNQWTRHIWRTRGEKSWPYGQNTARPGLLSLTVSDIKRTGPKAEIEIAML